MNINTAWVKPPRLIGGLDHLAVQAPCISIYGKLLPGITNVTDRARYYSFYPWIVWALEKQGHVFNDRFIDLFRKADILFTLIAHRHADINDDASGNHAGATIGTANLAKQLQAIRAEQPVILSEYSHRDPERKKYFKNKLGGLGQYYLGVLSELNIMNGTIGQGIQNTRQVGNRIAEAFAMGVDGKLFLQTLEEDTVSVDRLDMLSTFCPCQLTSNPQEHELLVDMCFVHGELFNEPDLLPRRRTLQTILHIADGLADQGYSIDQHLFRSCVYSNALPDGSPLNLPKRLSNNLNRWSIYQRNELLSLAVQGIFYVLLESYAELAMPLPSSAAVSKWFMTTREVTELVKQFDLDLALHQAVADYGSSIPQLVNWTEQGHEVQQAQKIEELCSKEATVANRAAILELCVATLFNLYSRQQTEQGYGDLVFPGNYFQYYPINLRSFHYHCTNTWQELTVREWLTWLCTSWGIEAHLRVALRKLQGQTQASFRIRPTDDGMVVDDVPPAVFTTPRFRQAVQVLQDIGALQEQNGLLQSTSLGARVKEIADA